MKKWMTTGACAIAAAVAWNGIQAQTNEEANDSLERLEEVDEEEFEGVIEEWAERPRQVANEMREQYGLPLELTDHRAIWHNEGVWKRIMVVNETVEHHFPEEHQDVLYQTVNYRVPEEFAGDLIEMSGSLIIDRTRGELTARCRDEEANILTLNLAHQIIGGDKEPKSARDVMADVLLEDRHEEMVARLFFSPRQVDGADPDVEYGAPERESDEQEHD